MQLSDISETGVGPTWGKVKTPTSRKRREKWGTRGEMGHPAKFVRESGFENSFWRTDVYEQRDQS
jgi:hypothetical protein